MGHSHLTALTLLRQSVFAFAGRNGEKAIRLRSAQASQRALRLSLSLFSLLLCSRETHSVLQHTNAKTETWLFYTTKTSNRQTPLQHSPKSKRIQLFVDIVSLTSPPPPQQESRLGHSARVCVCVGEPVSECVFLHSAISF